MAIVNLPSAAAEDGDIMHKEDVRGPQKDSPVASARSLPVRIESADVVTPSGPRSSMGRGLASTST
jgi:hypothetical protein